MRDSPLYYILQARIQAAKGSNEESVTTLLAAMKLPGVKQAGECVIESVSGIEVYLCIRVLLLHIVIKYIYFYSIKRELAIQLNLKPQIALIGPLTDLPAASGAAPKKKGKKAISLADRVSVYLDLAQAYWKLGRTTEANKVIQDAETEFTGTTEEIRCVRCHRIYDVLNLKITPSLRLSPYSINSLLLMSPSHNLHLST